ELVSLVIADHAIDEPGVRPTRVGTHREQYTSFRKYLTEYAPHRVEGPLSAVPAAPFVVGGLHFPVLARPFPGTILSRIAILEPVGASCIGNELLPIEQVRLATKRVKALLFLSEFSL